MTFTPLVVMNCRPYLDSADLTGWSNKIEASASAVDLKSTNFLSGGWEERVGGLKDFTGVLDGFWEASDLSKPDDLFWQDLGGTGNVPFTIIPDRGSVGDVAYVTRVFEAGYKPGAQVGQLLAWSTDFKGDWPVARGQVLHPNGTARTTTGTGTAVQLGAMSATQALYVTLHVFSISGTSTPTITVAIENNVDNTFSSPATSTTFTAATVIGGQAARVAGPVTNAWYRAKWTISGTTPSFMFAVSAGIASL